MNEKFEKFNDAMVAIGDPDTKIILSGYGPILRIGRLNCQSFKIPNGVTIVASAYNKESDSDKYSAGELKELFIPDSVSYITYEAFSGRYNLERIDGASRVKALGYRAFDGCQRLINLIMPNVCLIDDSAVAHCPSLRTVHISKHCYVGVQAFEQSSLKIFDGGIVTASTRAFNVRNPLESIDVNVPDYKQKDAIDRAREELTEIDIKYTGDGGLRYYESIGYIAKNAFSSELGGNGGLHRLNGYGVTDIEGTTLTRGIKEAYLPIITSLKFLGCNYSLTPCEIIVRDLKEVLTGPSKRGMEEVKLVWDIDSTIHIWAEGKSDVNRNYKVCRGETHTLRQLYDSVKA